MREATGAAVNSRQNERVARQIELFKRKCGEHREEALKFAYHAALPVALDPEFLHLLRINFFVDIDCPLPYEVEFEFLLSPLCRQIDEGLYEVEREVRLVLLEGLGREFGQERMREVAMLLWEYVEQQEPWIERVGLERAQQLTVLNFLDWQRTLRWLEAIKTDGVDTEKNNLEWIVAMRSESAKIISILNSDFEGNLDTITVWTPHFRKVELPAGATVLDFAYSIHSLLGHYCERAVVNGTQVSESTELKDGDMVEIIKGDKCFPKREWLNFVVTTLAKRTIEREIRKREISEGWMLIKAYLGEGVDNYRFALDIYSRVNKYSATTEAVRKVASGELKLADIRSWIVHNFSSLKPLLKPLSSDNDCEREEIRRLIHEMEMKGKQNLDLEASTILQEFAKTDKSEDVRTAMLQKLAWDFKQESETVYFLKERTQMDDSKEVRKAALQELARGWKEDPEILAFLKERAQMDDSKEVRKAALQELARGWKEDPEILAFLKERAQIDGNYLD